MKWVELVCPRGHEDKVPEDLDYKEPTWFTGDYWMGQKQVLEDRNRTVGQHDRDLGKVVWCGRCQEAFNPNHKSKWAATQKNPCGEIPMDVLEEKLDTEHDRMVAFFFNNDRGWGKS